MARTKYDLMIPSSGVSDGYGGYYPDIATFSINGFIPTQKPLRYSLNETDVYRFDSLINSYYGEFQLYDDLTLWLNDIPYLTSGYIGSGIKFYNKADIDDWYTKNS